MLVEQVAVEGRRVIAFTLRYVDERQLWDKQPSRGFADAVVWKLEQVGPASSAASQEGMH